VLGFGIAVLVHLGQIVLGFYGFWLVWRVLLPVLPGPPRTDERIAPFAGYFTDPLTAPLVGLLRLPPWLATLIVLLADAAALAALGRAG
jgi:hypothetical protein